MKIMVQQGLEGSSDAALAMEKFAQSALLQTEDKREGIKRFWKSVNPISKDANYPELKAVNSTEAPEFSKDILKCLLKSTACLGS